MKPRTSSPRPMTAKLGDDKLWDLSLSEPNIDYRPVPVHSAGNSTSPLWRVRLEPTFGGNARLGLDVYGEVVLGRDDESPDAVSLNAYDADELGVSRRHAMLRPTETRS